MKRWHAMGLTGVLLLLLLVVLLASASVAFASNTPFARSWSWSAHHDTCHGSNYMAYTSGAKTTYENTQWRFHFTSTAWPNGIVSEDLYSGSSHVYNGPELFVESYTTSGDIVGASIGVHSTVGSTYVKWEFADYGNYTDPYTTAKF